MLGRAGGVLFKDELSRGPHIPNRVRNAKSSNIMSVYRRLRWHEWNKTPSKRPSLPPIAKYIRCINVNNGYCVIPKNPIHMEQTSSSPATNNAIRGAEQSGNIAKQWFARTRWVRGLA